MHIPKILLSEMQDEKYGHHLAIHPESIKKITETLFRFNKIRCCLKPGIKLLKKNVVLRCFNTQTIIINRCPRIKIIFKKIICWERAFPIWPLEFQIEKVTGHGLPVFIPDNILHFQ